MKEIHTSYVRITTNQRTGISFVLATDSIDIGIFAVSQGIVCLDLFLN